jgi:hypothetical protein
MKPSFKDQGNNFKPFLCISTILEKAQKLELKHLLSKYQVMNEMQSFNAERNFYH